MLRAIVADADKDELDHLINLIDWKKEGIDLIATATDGNGLLKQIKSLHPDLVILDTDVSGEIDWIENKTFSGQDIVEHYHPFKHHVRFIVVSNRDDFDTIKRALRCEALDYLKKPVR